MNIKRERERYHILIEFIFVINNLFFLQLFVFVLQKYSLELLENYLFNLNLQTKTKQNKKLIFEKKKNQF